MNYKKKADALVESHLLYKQFSVDVLDTHAVFHALTAARLLKDATNLIVWHNVVAELENRITDFEETATLKNGQVVKEGDKVSYIDSDGVKHVGVVKRRTMPSMHCETLEVLKKGTLFFRNYTFSITDHNLELS